MTHEEYFDNVGERLVEIAKLEYRWEEMEQVYGKKTADKLRKLAPADPDLFYDFVFADKYTNGTSEKKMKKTLDAYTDADWENAFGRFEKLAKRIKKDMLKAFRDIA